MIKNELEADAAAVSSNDQLPFERRGFTRQQTQTLLGIKNTKFFEILPELEHYLDGNRIIVMGRSIAAYQDRRLAETRSPRAVPEPPRKSKTRKENGAGGNSPRAP